MQRLSHCFILNGTFALAQYYAYTVYTEVDGDRDFTQVVSMEDLKMSLKLPRFGKSFSPKKIPPRKSPSLSSLHTLDRSTREIELGLEYGSPSMCIGGHTLKFEDGHWLTESGGNVSVREVERLKKKNLQLEEENNILKLKIEILIDMLTESTVEYHLMEKEVEEIKSQH